MREARETLSGAPGPGKTWQWGTKMRRIVRPAIGVATLVLALSGCGGSGGGGSGGTFGGVCAPGMSVACACPNAAQGAQICNANGTGYGACTCSGPGAAGTTGSAGATGAAGATGGAGSGTAGTIASGGTGGGAAGTTGAAGSAGGAGTGGVGATGGAVAGMGGASGGAAGSGGGGASGRGGGAAGSGGAAAGAGGAAAGAGGATAGASGGAGAGGAAATCGGSGSGGTGAVGALLGEDFEDCVADGWMQTNTATGTWAVTADGTNHVYRQGVQPTGVVWVVHRQPTWSDLRVQARIRFNSEFGTGTGRIHLAARYTDPDNCYRANLRLNGEASVQRGAASPFIDHTVPLSLGRWYTLALTVRGRSVTLELDGVVLETATDSDTLLPAGGIAIGINGATADVDDILVTAP